jgi:hypothetical protein
LWGPSHKPLADPLKGYLFDLVAGKGNELRTRTDLSFEKTISLLGWGIEFFLERCYGTRGSAPNAWHHLIAGLMSQGLVRAVFTTNFDRLIEGALDEWGATYQTIDLPTYRLPRGVDLAKSDPPTLDHVHGTFDVSTMVASLPQVLNFSEAEGLWRPLTRFLRSKRRTLLVVGYSARDADLAFAIKAAYQRCKGSIVALNRGTGVGSPRFGALEGAFEGLSGFTYIVPEFHDFIEHLWRESGLGNWECRGAALMKRPTVSVWRRIVREWRSGLPPSSVDYVARRLSLGVNDDELSRHPNNMPDSVIVSSSQGRIKFVGDIVAINAPDGKYMLAGSTDDQSGAVWWPVMNARLRSLGYLSGQHEVDARAFSGLGRELCHPAEHEIRFYLRRLTTTPSGSDPRVAGVHRLARRVLSTHEVLHALTRHEG